MTWQGKLTADDANEIRRKVLNLKTSVDEPLDIRLHKLTKNRLMNVDETLGNAALGRPATTYNRENDLSDSEMKWLVADALQSLCVDAPPRSREELSERSLILGMLRRRDSDLISDGGPIELLEPPKKKTNCSSSGNISRMASLPVSDEHHTDFLSELLEPKVAMNARGPQGSKVPWNVMRQELADYRAANGNCDVVTTSGRLGRWVSNQRQKYYKEELKEERINSLNELGFSWLLGDRRATLISWDERFDELTEFKRENGHCRVPKRGSALGRWVGDQRSIYKDGKLTDTKFNRLNSLNFEWKVGRGVY